MTAYNVTRSFLDRGIGRTDITADLVAAAVAMEVRNNGNLFIVCKNGAGAPVTLTLVAVADPLGRGGATVGDQVIAIPAAGIAFIPFFNPALFNNGAIASLTLSSATTVTIGFFEMFKAN